VTFRGWPSEALEFYEGLEADNSKAYWTAHKAVYEKQVREPMAQLLDELEPEFGPGKIFRPYRDMRFSADKTPYKTMIGAMVGTAGYVQLSANGLAAAAGMWEMGRDELQKYRDAVAAEHSGNELEQIIAALRRRKTDVMAHDTLRSAPRGYPPDHPRIELLRYKGLVAWKEWPVAAWLETSEPKKRLVSFLRETKPLSDWLTANVGPSHQASDR
jgi:uncharacterized protein (TIGR02453 family)